MTADTRASVVPGEKEVVGIHGNRQAPSSVRELSRVVCQRMVYPRYRSWRGFSDLPVKIPLARFGSSDTVQ